MAARTGATHTPSCGYATEQARQEYVKAHNHLSDEAAVKLTTQTMTADPDTTQPLYYWQLYSLLGDRYIDALVTDFYDRVYLDTDDVDFKSAFTTLSSKQHHIQTQASYWKDAFGGGKRYHGGKGRLRFHHENNARSVMNAKGAERWMYHMCLTLKQLEPVLAALDPRIPNCIIEFLETKMQGYAADFGWRYEPRDFTAAKQQHADVAVAKLQNKLEGKRATVSLKGKTVYSRRELEGMTVKTLKQIAAVLGLNVSDCVEKTDIIHTFAAATELIAVVDKPVFTLLALQRMRVKALKQMAKCLQLNTKKCVEKKDFIRIISTSPAVQMVVAETAAVADDDVKATAS